MPNSPNSPATSALVAPRGVELLIDLVVRGPILIRTSAVGPAGVDAVALRDADGHLVIPGDSLLGLLREALDELNDPALGAEWRSRAAQMKQGRRAVGSNEEHDAYLQARLAADPAARFPLLGYDFRSVAPVAAAGERTWTSVRVDHDTGAASSGHLRVLDCPVPAGERIVCRGAWRFTVSHAAQVEKILAPLLLAARWMLAVGQNRSVGFGRIEDVRIAATTTVEFVRPTFARSLGRLAPADDYACGVDFTFQDPVCVPQGVTNGNLFESEIVVAGEALRGALAAWLRVATGTPASAPDLSSVAKESPWYGLCHHFDRVRITRALPQPASTPPGVARVVPYSLATAGDRWIDFAALPDNDSYAPIDGQVPAFQPDWKSKDWQQVEQLYGLHSPGDELRVRTAIDSNERRALAGNLFAYRMLRPEGTVWRACVSLDPRDRPGLERLSDDQCRALLAQVAEILDLGWLHVGKTRARTRGRCFTIPPSAASMGPAAAGDHAGTYRLLLRAPTLMLAPWDYVDQSVMRSPAEIDRAFAKYWNELSNGAFEERSSGRYKRERLVGGYQAWRYRYDPSAERGPGALASAKTPDARIRVQASWPYNPTLLCDAGSVFTLKATSGRAADAARLVNEWLRYGLPLPAWAVRAYGATHHTNIYLPENGYGEIALHEPLGANHPAPSAVGVQPADQEDDR